MTNLLMGNLAVSSCILASISAQAATIAIDFGTGSEVSSPWPANPSNAGNTGLGVPLPWPLLLDGGALEITTSPLFRLFCYEGTAVGTCGTSAGLGTSTAYGLGVRNGRVAVGEFITLTVNPGFTATLDGFSVTGFRSGSVDQLTYSLDSGAVTTLIAPSVDLAVNSYSVNQGFISTVKFGAAAGNYSLASLTLDVSPVPEPASLGLAGAALLGIAFAGRRKRA